MSRGARPLIVLVLLACAGVPGVREGGDSRVLDGVPFHAQEAYQCGPASLAGVLNYWGVDAAPEEVAREVFSESARGTLGIDMVFYAEDRGLEARQYSGGPEDLRENIDSARPVIVMVDSGFWFYQRNHFMVVVGYNERGFIVNSGKERHKFLPRGGFLESWKRTGNWSLLVLPR